MISTIRKITPIIRVYYSDDVSLTTRDFSIYGGSTLSTMPDYLLLHLKRLSDSPPLLPFSSFLCHFFDSPSRFISQINRLLNGLAFAALCMFRLFHGTYPFSCFQFLSCFHDVTSPCTFLSLASRFGGSLVSCLLCSALLCSALLFSILFRDDLTFCLDCWLGLLDIILYDTIDVNTHLVHTCSIIPILREKNWVVVDEFHLGHRLRQVLVN